MDTVHFFTQLYWLESGFTPTVSEVRHIMLPRRLQITVRHSDWWYWESNEPLRMERNWIKGLKQVHSGLKQFVVVLETIERDRNQVSVVATMK